MIAIKVIGVVVMLVFWFLTQKLIGQKSFDTDGIGDKILDWTAGWNKHLQDHPKLANGLLITSSLGIDGLGLFLLGSGIFGPSVTPLVGMFILFGLRQICQYLTALPPPEGMIWRDPGFPSILVTYDVGNDLFFSAHTALTVYGAAQLWMLGHPLWIALSLFLIVYEVSVVLILRAHWTMDVFTGAVTALLVHLLALELGPMVDALMVLE